MLYSFLEQYAREGFKPKTSYENRPWYRPSYSWSDGRDYSKPEVVLG
jgi:hypothetical protein